VEPVIEERVGAVSVPLVLAVEHVMFEMVGGVEVLRRPVELPRRSGRRGEGEDRVFGAGLDEQGPGAISAPRSTCSSWPSMPVRNLGAAHVPGDLVGLGHDEKNPLTTAAADPLVPSRQEKGSWCREGETDHAEAGRVDEVVVAEHVEAAPRSQRFWVRGLTPAIVAWTRLMSQA